MSNIGTLHDDFRSLAVDPNGPELEVPLDELRFSIRRSEISKAKYELECLHVSGAPVDEWLKEVDLQAMTEPPPRSVRTDASGAANQPSSDAFSDSDTTEGEGTSASASASSAVASSRHQPTTSGSQAEDEHDEDVNGTNQSQTA